VKLLAADYGGGDECAERENSGEIEQIHGQSPITDSFTMKSRRTGVNTALRRSVFL
jgi:hypothetical protein